MSSGATPDERIGPLVIAHRGASGYLPEHTLPAKALAYGQGAHFLEQDVVATRDDRLIVMHDIHLDRVTDVVERYPDRARADGRWYARDFDLAEIQTLSAYERMDEQRAATVFPSRFPHRSGRFGIPSLDEELDLVLGLNRSTGRTVGIYPEIKRPAWHHAEGVDVARLMLALLDRYGYRRRTDPVYLQCFDDRETRRLREELGTELRVVQLIAENDWGESATDYDVLKSARGMAQIAEYADAIGPWIGQLYVPAEGDGIPASTGLAELAHDNGLAVHAYTFRADALAPGFERYDEMVRWFVESVMIDGLFTDFTDLTLKALERR